MKTEDLIVKQIFKKIVNNWNQIEDLEEGDSLCIWIEDIISNMPGDMNIVLTNLNFYLDRLSDFTAGYVFNYIGDEIVLSIRKV